MWKRKLLLLMVLFVASFLFFNYTIQKYKKKINSTVITDIDLTKIEDGIYHGQYNAYIVKAKVKVEVKEHQIKSIKIVEHENGRGEGAEKIIDEVVKQQNLKVDTVTGATASSKVILKAIEYALTGKIDE